MIGKPKIYNKQHNKISYFVNLLSGKQNYSTKQTHLANRRYERDLNGKSLCRHHHRHRYLSGVKEKPHQSFGGVLKRTRRRPPWTYQR